MNSNFSLIAEKDQFQKQKQRIQNEGERMKEKEKMEGIWQSQITFTITWRIMTKSPIIRIPSCFYGQFWTN